APSGGCTLRAAIMEANAHAGPDRVLLAAQTYHLTIPGSGAAAGDLDVTSDVTLVGAGSTVVLAADGLDRALDVSSGSLTISDVVLGAIAVGASPACLLASAPVHATN